MPRPWLQLLDPSLNTLKAAEPSTLEGQLALAKAFNARARHAEACELLDKVLAQDRTHGEAWFELHVGRAGVRCGKSFVCKRSIRSDEEVSKRQAVGQ